MLEFSRSPCPGSLKQIATAQRNLFADHNRDTTHFAELEGLVIDSSRPYVYALDSGHPSGVTDCPSCQFVATCTINLPTRQVWSIASFERTSRGETVPAFAPLNDISGE